MAASHECLGLATSLTQLKHQEEGARRIVRCPALPPPVWLYGCVCVCVYVGVCHRACVCVRLFVCLFYLLPPLTIIGVISPVW